MKFAEKIPPAPEESIWRLSVEQYHQMIQSGILTEDDPVELLDGLLVPKMTKTPAHTLATQLTRLALEGVIPAGWFVNDQEPITLEGSEPEPDVSVIRGERRNFLTRHPSPGEVSLLAEIAETSLSRDRTKKKGLFARAGIAIFWIVNLQDRCVEIYSEPVVAGSEWDYRQIKVYHPGDTLPVILDGQEKGHIQAADLFP